MITASFMKGLKSFQVNYRFCWYITKSSWSKLIFVCRLIDQQFYYQVLWSLLFWTLKKTLNKWPLYGISFMAQLTFSPLQKLVVLNILNVHKTHLNFPEHILWLPIIDSFTIWKQPLKIRRSVLEIFKIFLQTTCRGSSVVIKHLINDNFINWEETFQDWSKARWPSVFQNLPKTSFSFCWKSMFK